MSGSGKGVWEETDVKKSETERDWRDEILGEESEKKVHWGKVELTGTSPLS